MQNKADNSLLAQRFRGFFPVVIDIETAGFNSATDAILEIAAVLLSTDTDGQLYIASKHSYCVEPFVGANLDPSSLAFTGIDPSDPDRQAVSETEALKALFRVIRTPMKAHHCTRAILVGHNAHFDHRFIAAACERCQLKRSPFHPFSVFDTVTLAGLAFGETVLAKACRAAGFTFDDSEAHSAAYDAYKTAALFCAITNQWRRQRTAN